MLQRGASKSQESYFGEPWPSGICENSERTTTPLGIKCLLCSEEIQEGDQGSFMTEVGLHGASLQPVHKECSLRNVLGGIGHLENHPYWCTKVQDPDGGRTYRKSALEVWQWCQKFPLSKHHQFPKAAVSKRTN